MKEGADILKIAGEALYGHQWQSPLSRDLNITDRTVRNWASGSPRPADLTDRLLIILHRRAAELGNVISLVEAHRKVSN